MLRDCPFIYVQASVWTGRSIATVSGEQAKGLNEVTQCFSENMALTIQTVSSEVVCVHFYTHFRSFQIAQFKENALN